MIASRLGENGCTVVFGLCVCNFRTLGVSKAINMPKKRVPMDSGSGFLQVLVSLKDV